MADNKHGKASKAGRNYRINGASRSHSQSRQTTSTTKYVRDGGPLRAAKRAANNHGCQLPALHKRGSRDQQHAHRRADHGIATG